MLPGVLLVGLAAAAIDPGPAPDAAADRKVYEAERAKVGNSADAHVRLALWCEARGMHAERTRHLALAVLNDPRNALARGLMGMVAHEGRWERPEAVGDKLRADAARAEAFQQYLQKRARTPETADDQWKLALWCDQNGLKEQAVAHAHAVLRLDPTREAAWKRLGYKKHQGRWVTDAQLHAEKEESALQKQADRQWRPVLEGYRRALGGKDQTKRTAAGDDLARVADPRAVPSIWAVFAASKNADDQALAVQLLGQIDAASASRALAMLAVSSPSAEVRRAAGETLKRRDVREFADLLISLIREPIKYEVKQVGGQGSPGSLSVKGKEADVKRLYTPPPVQVPGILPTDQFTYDQFGMPAVVRHFQGAGIIQSPGVYGTVSVSGPAPGVTQNFPTLIAKNGGGEAGRAAAQKAIQNARAGNVGSSSFGFPSARYLVNQAADVLIPIGQFAAEAENANNTARRRLESDIQQIEAHNRAVAESNDRVLPVLAMVAGQDLGPDRASWNKWWVDQIGFTIVPQKSQEKATVVEQVPIDYQPQPVAPTVLGQSTTVIRRLASCFAAGTLIKTRDGLRPIETLRVGDLVLTQNVKTGALGYQPVFRAIHNPPSTTFRISLGNEPIISSQFHRFWKAGHGWVMARDLKAGDALRTLDGVATVSGVEADRVQPVFNLEVAEDCDFFVGTLGALVHDNTLPDLRLAPFDAPAVATLARP
jgi:hypothetical protein